jgi:acetyl esterase
VAGVAPAHVVTAGFDALREEGERYARKLVEAGVPTTHHCEENLVHGFFSLGGVLESARVAADRAIRCLAHALHG